VQPNGIGCRGSRDEGGIHHHWASEMTFKRGDSSSLDPVWAIYGVLDLTREGAETAVPTLTCSTKKSSNSRSFPFGSPCNGVSLHLRSGEFESQLTKKHFATISSEKQTSHSI
jgi:hypothetical protein